MLRAIALFASSRRNGNTGQLMDRIAKELEIFASPVYWYSVSPPMKVFLDRISDFLDLPDLLDQGRRLRGKQAYIVCTSVDDEVSKAFLDALTDTFQYLGMRFGGIVHVDCRDGYIRDRHDAEAVVFAQRLRNANEARKS